MGDDSGIMCPAVDTPYAHTALNQSTPSNCVAVGRKGQVRCAEMWQFSLERTGLGHFDNQTPMTTKAKSTPGCVLANA